MNGALKNHAIIGVNTHATFHMYEQRRPIKFGRADLTLLMRVRSPCNELERKHFPKKKNYSGNLKEKIEDDHITETC